ncbi:MAG TPA: IclR family transcriptional regulator [Asticcacaulis sp.]|nr:IclR family transcriptional regulator [Asticcacaulis sp.]
MTDDSPLRKQRYSAPALEKGLDILELLSERQRPLTVSQISSALDRSISELFRMVQVLEARGYLAINPNGEGYELTNKLFSVGISRSPSQNLIVSAVPLMQKLSADTRQSCHLAIAVGTLMVVIARIETPGDLGFSVRVGYQRPLVHSTSGIVLYGFQPHSTKLEWRRKLRAAESEAMWLDFETRAEQAVRQGFAERPSEFVDAVTDISCPIFGDTGVTAALTMPHLRARQSASLEESLAALKLAAKTLSDQLATTSTR